MIKELEKENNRLKKLVAKLSWQGHPQGNFGGKLLSPPRKRKTIEHVQQTLKVPERRACTVLSQPRSTQNYKVKNPDKDRALTQEIKKLAKRYQRYGYRMITAKLFQYGWLVNHKRVHQIWSKEGLQMPYRRKYKKARGSKANRCDIRKAEYMNHVWTYDFVSDQNEDGRTLKMLTILDEFTRESLAIEVALSIKAEDVMNVLDYLFAIRGMPGCIRSDNGPEFIASQIKKRLKDNGVETLYVKPGSPWENGYIESFNSTLRDEALNHELFYSLKEAKMLVEQWRLEYNHRRPP